LTQTTITGHLKISNLFKQPFYNNWNYRIDKNSIKCKTQIIICED